MATPRKTSKSPVIPKISLVLADVDGTLVNEDKVLTRRAQAAVQRLHDVGIRFAIELVIRPDELYVIRDLGEGV